MASQEPEYERGLVWFRRDLRIDDHAALHHALTTCRQVFCVFVFDTQILDPLLQRNLVKDRRVEFIRDSVVELDAALRDASPGHKAALVVRHGAGRAVIPELAATLKVDAVFVNHDYEPTAVARDRDIADALARDDRAFLATKDQTLFEKDEVLTKGATPFSVFTPYKRAWLKTLDPFHVKAYPVERYVDRLAAVPSAVHRAIPTLAAMGFAETDFDRIQIPTGASGAHRLIDAFADRMRVYDVERDYPAHRGTSYLSVHLRFGTVSIRALARAAIDRAKHAADARGADTWLNELIWRDFYFQILHHRPDLADGAAFKPKFDRVAWVDGQRGDALFDAWCGARTGYPLIDAAMTQINSSGFMHNRLRMVTASFLSKDLGLDWRRGERYFAENLNDFEFSSNNGGWQWASSSGCDAQPWFRIFNPVTQSQRFDPDGAFIRRYVPALARLSNRAIHAPWLASATELARAGVVLDRDYPRPIVDHEEARAATLERYAVVKAA